MGLSAMRGDEFVDRFRPRPISSERQLERGLQIQQRRRPGIAGQRLLHVPQRGPRLLAFDHAVNFFDLADQIGAAELQLLAAAAGAQRIGINSHDATVSTDC